MEQSVYDNLFLSCSFHGLSPGRARNRANDLIELFGLAHKASQSVNRLSGGMIRRVALARAFAGDPYLLLLDEPTVGLDAESKKRFHSFLLELVRPGNMAVVIASHDPVEMSRLGDRRIELDDGHVVSTLAMPAQAVEEQVSVTVWFLRTVGDESVDIFSKWADRIERVDRRALKFYLSGAVSLNRFLKVLGTAEPIVGISTAETGIGVASA
jgi:ABC-type multidrug transport system ATPase subunit